MIRRCLEKDARHRFQSARDLAYALEAVATEGRSGLPFLLRRRGVSTHRPLSRCWRSSQLWLLLRGCYRGRPLLMSGGARKPLIEAMSPGVYDAGRLFFVRDEKLFAQAFDPVAVTLSGEPELIAENVWTDGQGVAGLCGFDVVNGIIAWRPSLSRRVHLTWKARDGRTLEAIQAPGEMAMPSPDGRLLMLGQPDYQMNAVGFAILDRERGSITRFTAPDTTSTSTVWSPDSRGVVYSSLRDGAYDLYVKEVRPGGDEWLLLHTDGMKAASSWSSDGQTMLFTATSPKTRLDVWAIPAKRGATATRRKLRAHFNAELLNLRT